MRAVTLSIKKNLFLSVKKNLHSYALPIIVFLLIVVSVVNFIIFYKDGLGLAYNDARSHLDIGRRVVEGLKPGFAQLGSVWLPLPHLLMIPTIWNDFFWHSGLSGAIQSMVSFVITGILIYYYLEKLGVKLLGKIVGVTLFATNLNIMYLQSTAMTELLLVVTMTAATYELLLWHKNDNLYTLIKVAFFVFLSTLIRYDGWFLFLFAAFLIAFRTIRKGGYKSAEGITILFCTLGGFGIFLWLFWNHLIFHDSFYFIFGPYSAHAQQTELAKSGVLVTKGNLFYSIKVYLYAMAYNSTLFMLLLGGIGAVMLWFDKNLTRNVRIATSALLVPLFFNVVALYLGHSVLFVAGLSGNSWFNVRYGILMMPSLAILIGYLVHKAVSLRVVIIGLLIFVSAFSFLNKDAVTIDDARVGASGKNVSEVSGWIKTHAETNNNYILISAASHDAIIFSSGLPMKRFIHEGTGKYWDEATVHPDRWARFIVMRTGDQNDLTNRLISQTKGIKKYKKVQSFPFADIYEIRPEFLSSLQTGTPFEGQK